MISSNSINQLAPTPDHHSLEVDIINTGIFLYIYINCDYPANILNIKRRPFYKQNTYMKLTLISFNSMGKIQNR